RPLLRPHGPRRARRAEGPRPTPIGPAGRPRRPRPPGTADPGRLRRQEHPHRIRRVDQGTRRRARRRGRRGADASHRHGRGQVIKHLLSAGDLDAVSANLVLDTAAEMASLAGREVKKLPTLRGRTVVNLFYEDSTRTRISFEAAAKRLSADVINFSAKGSSVSKGESLKDTALT